MNCLVDSKRNIDRMLIIELMRKCLNFDRSKRPSITTVLIRLYHLDLALTKKLGLMLCNFFKVKNRLKLIFESIARKPQPMQVQLDETTFV